MYSNAESDRVDEKNLREEAGIDMTVRKMIGWTEGERRSWVYQK